MVTPSELERNPLFAVLSPEHRTRVASRAADIHVKRGEWLVHDGDPPYFWAVLEGELESVRMIAGAFQQMTTFDPDEYFGEVPLMLGAASFSGVRALRPSRVARIDPSDFRALLDGCSEASEILSQTLLRRVGLIGKNYSATDGTQAIIVGDRYDFACHDIRDFLSRNEISYVWFDPGDDGDAPYIPESARSAATYPIVTFPDGGMLITPSLRELARRLKLQTEPSTDCFDVVIIGGGPAGLAAAVYGGSEGLHTMLIEREAPGGQAGTSSRIENYLGFPGGVSGGDLANRALNQAKRFGTEILVTRSVESIVCDGDDHVLTLDGGSAIRARAIVIATGVSWRKLENADADRLIGRGIYYGAARTEALGTRGKDIFLVGGGNSAGQAAMFFANYARSVTLLVRGESLEKGMSYYLIEQLRTKENIAVETHATVCGVAGSAHVEAISICDSRTGGVSVRPADAVFTFIGADAETAWLPPQIERDARGYVLTGRDVGDWHLERAPFSLETSVPGIFAAGDVRSTSVKRVASGVGEGSMVISFIHEYLALRDGRTTLDTAPKT